MATDGVIEHAADLKAAALLKSEGKVMEQMLAGQMAMMGLQDRSVLLKKMKLTLRYSYGAVEALRFGSTRYGMIKLHGIAPGTLVSRRNANTYTLKGKAAQDWWTPVASRQLPKIANKLAVIRADQAMKVSEQLNIDGKNLVHRGYSFPS